MAEAGGRQGEQTEHLHQGVHPAVTKAQAGRTSLLHHHGLGHGVEAIFPNEAIVAQRFDAQEARLILVFLYCTWREGTTPSVKMRVRKRPGVRRVTRRLKMSCI